MRTFVETSFNIQRRVIAALILRDMRTRFGNSLFGFILIVALPLSHLLILMLVYLALRGRIPLLGTNATVFWGTAVLPYILCVYPARMTATSLSQNRPLLTYPIVKSIDVIAARGVLEVLVAFWVAGIFCLVLILCGVDIMPNNIFDAIAAMLATICLGFSVGCLSAVLVALVPAWSIIQMALLLIMYFTSGVFFLPSALPERLQYWVSFNPLMHSVEWLRSAYYEGHGYGLLDRGYIFSFSTILIFAALVIERFARGKVMMRR